MSDQSDESWNPYASTILESTFTNSRPKSLFAVSRLTLVKDERMYADFDHDRIEATACLSYSEGEPINAVQLRTLRHVEDLIRAKIKELEEAGVR